MKICRNCLTDKLASEFYAHPNKVDGLQSYCKECIKARSRRKLAEHPEYFREWRRANPDLRHRSGERRGDPERIAASDTVRSAVSEGRLVKPPLCEGCGDPKEARKLDGHHDDYSRPLSVRWLCRECHVAVHVEMRRAA